MTTLPFPSIFSYPVTYFLFRSRFFPTSIMFLSSIAMAPWQIIFWLRIVIMVPFWMRMFILFASFPVVVVAYEQRYTCCEEYGFKEFMV